MAALALLNHSEVLRIMLLRPREVAKPEGQEKNKGGKPSPEKPVTPRDTIKKQKTVMTQRLAEACKWKGRYKDVLSEAAGILCLIGDDKPEWKFARADRDHLNALVQDLKVVETNSSVQELMAFDSGYFKKKSSEAQVCELVEQLHSFAPPFQRLEEEVARLKRMSAAQTSTLRKGSSRLF